MSYGPGRHRARRRTRHAIRFVGAAAVVGAVVLFGAPTAHAEIVSDPVPANAAEALADALLENDSLSGSFITNPTPTVFFPKEVASYPYAVSTTDLAGFPTAGEEFAILSTGDVNDITQARDASGTTTTDYNAHYSEFLHDVSILKIDFTVPSGANCLSFDFRFLTEEFPDASTNVNDAFIAELGGTTWSATSTTINDGNNFAFAPNGNPITVDALGVEMVAGPTDTMFDGATAILTATTPVGPSDTSLYLSLVDFPDPDVDSAVFVDNLIIGTVADQSKQCQPGAGVKYDFGLAADGTEVVGTNYTVTSTLKDLAGTAVAGVDVIFLVDGVATGSPVATDGDGKAQFSYTAAAAGTDTVIACADTDDSGTCDGGDPTDSVQVVWTAPPTPSPTGTGGGSFGLAPTGTVAGMIAGVGVVVLALGAGLFIMGRRRKATASE